MITNEAKATKQKRKKQTYLLRAHKKLGEEYVRFSSARTCFTFFFGGRDRERKKEDRMRVCSKYNLLFLQIF